MLVRLVILGGAAFVVYRLMFAGDDSSSALSGVSNGVRMASGGDAVSGTWAGSPVVPISDPSTRDKAASYGQIKGEAQKRAPVAPVQLPGPAWIGSAPAEPKYVTPPVAGKTGWASTTTKAVSAGASPASTITSSLARFGRGHF